MAKQAIKWTLFGLNLLLITLLTLFSFIFLYFSLARPTELFGHTGLLLKNESTAESTFYLLECRPTAFVEGDQLLIADSSGTPRLYTAIRMADNSLAAAADTGDTFPLFSPTVTPALLGRTVYRSEALGTLLYTAIQPENLPLAYFLIGGGFLLCLLALAGIYLFFQRRQEKDPFTGEAAILRAQPELPPPPLAEYDTSPLTEYDTSPLTEYDTAPLAKYDAAPLTKYDTSPLTKYDTAPLAEYDTSPLAKYDTPLLAEDDGEDDDIKLYRPAALTGEADEEDIVLLQELQEEREIDSVLADIEKLFDEASRF